MVKPYGTALKHANIHLDVMFKILLKIKTYIVILILTDK